MYHNRPARRPMVSRIFLRAMLFLPLLRDTGHASHNESISNTYWQCASWRQSSNSHRTIPFRPSSAHEKILRETLLHQTPRGSSSSQSDSRPPVASGSKTPGQEREVAEETPTPGLEDADSTQTGGLSNNANRERDSRYLLL